MFSSNLLIPRKTTFDIVPSGGRPFIDSKSSQRNTLKSFIRESDSGQQYTSNLISKGICDKFNVNEEFNDFSAQNKMTNQTRIQTNQYDKYDIELKGTRSIFSRKVNGIKDPLQSRILSSSPSSLKKPYYHQNLLQQENLEYVNPFISAKKQQLPPPRQSLLLPPPTLQTTLPPSLQPHTYQSHDTWNQEDPSNYQQFEENQQQSNQSPPITPLYMTEEIPELPQASEQPLIIIPEIYSATQQGLPQFPQNVQTLPFTNESPQFIPEFNSFQQKRFQQYPLSSLEPQSFPTRLNINESQSQNTSHQITQQYIHQPLHSPNLIPSSLNIETVRSSPRVIHQPQQLTHFPTPSNTDKYQSKPDISSHFVSFEPSLISSPKPLLASPQSYEVPQIRFLPQQQLQQHVQLKPQQENNLSYQPFNQNKTQQYQLPVIQRQVKAPPVMPLHTISREINLNHHQQQHQQYQKQWQFQQPLQSLTYQQPQFQLDDSNPHEYDVGEHVAFSFQQGIDCDQLSLDKPEVFLRNRKYF